jgi:KRAB domain-containing zinc finger protein
MHALNEHMEKTFICDLCGEGFVTEKSLHNHTSYHHHKNNRFAGKAFGCAYCEKTFKTVSYLEAHENEHKGVRPYICDACGKSFASNGMLRSHKFAHAPKIFKCDCCDQAFPRKNTLMVHLRAVHMHEKVQWLPLTHHDMT